MTHRGAVGADARDGDGAGVMTALPHRLLAQEAKRDLGITLPAPGTYAAGNVFLSPDEAQRSRAKHIFTHTAEAPPPKVLGWRPVPRDNSLLAPPPLSKEPVMEQPLIAFLSPPPDDEEEEEEEEDAEEYAPPPERQLYLLRKHATHRITPPPDGAEEDIWFYVCSLSTPPPIYKGQLAPRQVYDYFYDLVNVAFETHFALVHSRFSTNTFPSWDRAQPMREINTLRGNKNWMRSREGGMRSENFGQDLEKLYPIIEEHGSDSASFDNVLELLVVNGQLSIPEAIMMMIPEAWQNNPDMTPEKRAFYEWASCVMEPWDGPALFVFADGRYCGANLDRNGLRPCRYYITEDDTMICASEVGTIRSLDTRRVISKGRLEPGRMLLVDTAKGRLVDNEELKAEVANRYPYADWIKENALPPPPYRPTNSTTPLSAHPFPPPPTPSANTPPPRLLEDPRLRAFGLTLAPPPFLLLPMVREGKEALGSPPPDAPLACLSRDQPHPVYDYFRQLFAQVTNPPIDPIREAMVMSLACYVGPEGNLLEANPLQCKRLLLPSPILDQEDILALRAMGKSSSTSSGGYRRKKKDHHPLSSSSSTPSLSPSPHPQVTDWPVLTVDLTYPVREGIRGYGAALDRVCSEVSGAVGQGVKTVILSDKAVGPERVSLSAALAIGATHHHLVRSRQRSKVALVLETGEAREVHHMCVLLGYGADAIHPYLVYEVMDRLYAEGAIYMEGESSSDPSPVLSLMTKYRKAIEDGILKVMSKMGISTLASYKGAQIFEALGLGADVIDKCFVGTASRIGGHGMGHLAGDALTRHHRAWPRSLPHHSPYVGISREILQGPQYGDDHSSSSSKLLKAPLPSSSSSSSSSPTIGHTIPSALEVGAGTGGSALVPEPGEYHWRAGSGGHINAPTAVASLQEAATPPPGSQGGRKAYATFREETPPPVRACTLRGQLEMDVESPPPSSSSSSKYAVPLEEVAPPPEIVKRFATGAMSYGSTPPPAHTALAKAMNKLGGKSPPPEGGEEPERASSSSDRSAIKQVASGRFGVNSAYLASPPPLQIKMAQGAKPGEGGAPPPHKVSLGPPPPRHSTPGVGLISPPPHPPPHSIEDLKQLIYDLRSANPKARISVKLVSEVGVGIVAAGVAKAESDHILISGHDGGTGASRWTGIKHAGLPWELGLAETHQTLVLNGLRGRVTLQTDGQLRTGWDVAVACLLGAEEWGFATAPLIAVGCIMMRKCHLNTCPVGIATQDPELREKFAGEPEHVINYFHLVAEEMREWMARLGFRTVEEMVGRSERLRVRRSLQGRVLPSPLTPRIPEEGASKVENKEEEDEEEADDRVTGQLDLRGMLTPAHTLRPGVPTCKAGRGTGEEGKAAQRRMMYTSMDHRFIAEAEEVIEEGGNRGGPSAPPFFIEGGHIVNTDRAIGATLSYRVSRRWGEDGLIGPDRQRLHVHLHGSAGQSFGAFLAPGVSFTLEGDSNDYVGKGLSGGQVVVRTPKDRAFSRPQDHVIIGNTCLYGATAGRAHFEGQAAERFCVRNSGALAVVEGMGDHGCEYMTGGRVISLGCIGRNFGAGMSGGIAYLLHEHYNPNSINGAPKPTWMDPLSQDGSWGWGKRSEVETIWSLLEDHVRETGSEVAREILSKAPKSPSQLTWDVKAKILQSTFVQILPSEFKAVLEAEEEKNESAALVPEKMTEASSMEAKASEDPVLDIEDMHQQTGAGLDEKVDESPEALGKAVLRSAKRVVRPSDAAAKTSTSVTVIPSSKDLPVKVDKLRGFHKYQRRGEPYRDPKKRIKDWKEISVRMPPADLRVQASRCMDCGVPFCQSDDTGCPLGNVIPQWNNLVYRGQWREALERLLLTNNFPEFTGRVCPAPCEGSCVLGLTTNNQAPVNIKSIEASIIDRGFREGWMVPKPPAFRTGKRVAIIGSGPAGLAAADQLNKAGHWVRVFEREDRIGGLLMYGIPGMKLDKGIVERRVSLMRAEGVDFITNAHIGPQIPVEEVRKGADSIILATGSTWPRDLKIPNRNLDGIHFAMEYLTKNTKSILQDGSAANPAEQSPDEEGLISAKGKHVVVIGGGDTGNDCIGTAIRQGAASITNFELLPQPPSNRGDGNPWPQFPKVFRVDYGHAEVQTHYGTDPREYSILSKEFVSDGSTGRVKGVNTVRVGWEKDENGAWKMKELEGSEKFYPADLVLLSMGFLGPEKELLEQMKVEQDARSNIKTLEHSGHHHHRGRYETNVPGVFAAGDCRRGQSLVVWGINEGRQAARAVDSYLRHGQTSDLPVSGGILVRDGPVTSDDPEARPGPTTVVAPVRS
ncbi:MAG: NADH/NADPH, small subunit of glutamate synthase [Piptocephalis tieghemiana]|nr:MAG: NADH/NADPH, small subunit of glutamate synthase [Piptocephalis tieghemiana]